MKLIYTTFSNEAEAKAVAAQMLELKLAACVHILPKGSSMYVWEGNIIADDEFIALFKTVDENLAELMSKIEALHSYEVPCVLEVSIDSVVKSYNDWLVNSLSKK